MPKPIFILLIFLLTPFSGKSELYQYDVIPVEQKNLAAKLYLPKSNKKSAAVIAFGGFEGGFETGDAYGDLITPHGVAVLSLAYFNEANISPTLDQIPIEYFISAINYLQKHPAINASKIGVVAGSRGSEAAFLLATIDSRIKSIAVTTPSKVAWYGLTIPKSAWTYKNQDIPALGLALDEKAKLIDRFQLALTNSDSVNKSLFKFEKINGPLLMISAKHDQVWPSYQMAMDIERYLKDKQFKHAITHDSYKTGHGFSQESAPKIKKSIIEFFLRTLKEQS